MPSPSFGLTLQQSAIYQIKPKKKPNQPTNGAVSRDRRRPYFLSFLSVNQKKINK